MITVCFAEARDSDLDFSPIRLAKNHHFSISSNEFGFNRIFSGGIMPFAASYEIAAATKSKIAIIFDMRCPRCFGTVSSGPRYPPSFEGYIAIWITDQ